MSFYPIQTRRWGGGGGGLGDPIAKKLKNFKTVQAVNTKLSDVP